MHSHSTWLHMARPATPQDASMSVANEGFHLNGGGTLACNTICKTVWHGRVCLEHLEARPETSFVPRYGKKLEMIFRPGLPSQLNLSFSITAGGDLLDHVFKPFFLFFFKSSPQPLNSSPTICFYPDSNRKTQSAKFR
jgi:hypothetical protein